MKTFSGNLSTTFRLTVPDTFLQQMREAAQVQHPNNTPFLQAAHLAHPVNDDAFLCMIVRNGLRINTREAVSRLCSESGIGVSIAPSTVNIMAIPLDFNVDAQPVTITIGQESEAPEIKA